MMFDSRMAAQMNNEAVFLLRQQDPSLRHAGAMQLKGAVVLLESELRKGIVDTDGNSTSIATATTSSFSSSAVVTFISASATSSNTTPASEDIFQNYFIVDSPTMQVHPMQDSSILPLHQASQVYRQQQPYSEILNATHLAASMYNLALMRHLECKAHVRGERNLVKVARIYESAHDLILYFFQRPQEEAFSSSLALLLLAICTNACAIYEDLGDLPKYMAWQSRLAQPALSASLQYQRALLRDQGGSDDCLKCIQLTASVNGLFSARAA